MVPRPTFSTALARLVPGGGDPAAARCYRPLVAGPAILRRSSGARAWTVELAHDRLLRPRAPTRAGAAARFARALARRGMTCRIGAALAGPLDVPLLVGGDRGARVSACPQRPLRLDIYGWALMYQPPGMRGTAIVDADDRFTDLPAMFELPLELLDRAAFLEARGFRTRSLVIPTAPSDFERGADGRLRNRFFSCRGLPRAGESRPASVNRSGYPTAC